MKIDTSFNLNSDSRGGDPDRWSPTLKRYHKLLWSKPLPSGAVFHLEEDGGYLMHKSTLGTFHLGSDAITHSYRNHSKKRWITQQIPDAVSDFYDRNSTIASFTLFPRKQIGRQHTINQARGINAMIDDRFDLTLECIRRHYCNQKSPLTAVLERYADFFRLFESFDGYIEFFLLQDLIGPNGSIKFYFPLDDFRSRPGFNSVQEYLDYKRMVLAFIDQRTERIMHWDHLHL